MQLYIIVQQRFKLARNVGALFVNAEQVCPGFQVRRVHRNILRREALLDDPLHLVVGDRAKRGVIAVKKRKPDVLVAHEKRRPGVFRVALAEAKKTFVGALPRNDLLEHQPEILTLVAFDLDVPGLAVGLFYRQVQFGLARRLKTKIEIVAH